MNTLIWVLAWLAAILVVIGEIALFAWALRTILRRSKGRRARRIAYLAGFGLVLLVMLSLSRIVP
jgi:hypothetical protein